MGACINVPRRPTMSNIINFSVPGDLTVGGTLAAASFTIGTLIVENLEPQVDNTYTLGTPTLRWSDIYAVNATVSGTLNVGTLVIGTLETENINPEADNEYTLGTTLLRWASVYAVALNGTLQTPAQPNITSVGTLTGLTVAGNIVPSANNTYNLGSSLLQWANIYCANFTPAGNVVPSTDDLYNLGSMALRWATTYSANVVATNLTGTLQTAAQPNITSVGTLTGLTVAGSVVPSANNMYNLGSSLLQWANIYCASVTPTGNIIPSADNTYNLGSMTYRWATTYSVNVVSTNLSGTLQTAAQPNITSVGTLTSLTVTGSVTFSGVTTGALLSLNGSNNVTTVPYSTAATASNVAQRDLNGLLALTNNILYISDGQAGSALTTPNVPTTVFQTTIPGGTISGTGAGAVILVAQCMIIQTAGSNCSISLQLGGSGRATLNMGEALTAACKVCTIYVVWNGTGVNTQTFYASLYAAVPGTSTPYYNSAGNSYLQLPASSDQVMGIAVTWGSPTGTYSFQIYNLVVYTTLSVSAGTLP